MSQDDVTWKVQVMSKLDQIPEIKKDVKELREQDIPNIRTEIASLKAKATIWGGISAAVIYTIIKFGIG